MQYSTCRERGTRKTSESRGGQHGRVVCVLDSQPGFLSFFLDFFLGSPEFNSSATLVANWFASRQLEFLIVMFNLVICL